VATAPAPVCDSAPVALPPQTNCAAAGTGASIAAVAASPAIASPRKAPPASALAPMSRARRLSGMSIDSPAAAPW
jgi:hypothetical protein